MAMLMHADAAYCTPVDCRTKHADAVRKVEIDEDTIDATPAAHEYGHVAACTCPLHRLCGADHAAADAAGQT